MISADKIIVADLNKSDENFVRVVLISSVREVRHDVATFFQISANVGAFLMKLKMNVDWMLANSIALLEFMGMKNLGACYINLYSLYMYMY